MPDAKAILIHPTKPEWIVKQVHKVQRISGKRSFGASTLIDGIITGLVEAGFSCEGCHTKSDVSSRLVRALRATTQEVQ